MRVLFVADLVPNPDSGAGGSQYHTIRAVERHGCVVDAVWADGLPHRISHWNLHYLLELPNALRDVVRQRCQGRQYDVVDVYQPHAYAAAIEHHRLGRPGVFINRNADMEERFDLEVRSWQRRLGVRYRSPLKTIPGCLLDAGLRRGQRLVARYADGHVVMSSENRDWLLTRHGVPGERVACIPQAPPDEYLSKAPAPACGARLKHLLAVGQVVFYKGIHALTGAVNQLLGQDPEATFTWVCPRLGHDLAISMLDPQVRARVRVLCGLSAPELLDVTDGCGVFLFPSITEGFGKAFLEAMARGLCVVTTRTAGMRDVIRHGENGFLVEVNDGDGIVRAVRGLWQHPVLATAVSQAAIAEARLYTWDRVGRETVAFYEGLLRALPAGRRRVAPAGG